MSVTTTTTTYQATDFLEAFFDPLDVLDTLAGVGMLSSPDNSIFTKNKTKQK